MSVDTPSRCQPRHTICANRDLAAQVRRLRAQSMGVTSICEELDLPRDVVLMLARLS